MCQWVGWVVPWLALPELTPGLIQLEGQLGWSVEDDLVHTPEPLRFSLWPFTPQRDRLASIGGGLKVGFQERETGSLKASRPQGLGLKVTHRQSPLPFPLINANQSQQIRGLHKGMDTGRCTSLGPFCDDLPHRVKEEHRLQ